MKLLRSLFVLPVRFIEQLIVHHKISKDEYMSDRWLAELRKR